MLLVLFVHSISQILNFRSPSNNVQIIKISGRETVRGTLERQHRSITKVTLRGEAETRNIGAKRRASSFAAVTTTGVNLSLENRAPSMEKRLEDTDRSVLSLFVWLKCSNCYHPFFRLEKVKESIVRILIDKESVAKENNELKRYLKRKI